VKDYALSPQGIETIFATNVFGTFVIINILLPRLESTAARYGNSRIVVTGSSFHLACQELKFDLLMSPTPIKSPKAVDSCWRYARRYVHNLLFLNFNANYTSKLGSILFTRELAYRLEKRGPSKVYANCFFPGK
jgi:NAD(P)-dependent dehydrogenase (short-subunit alcohol dehydrogenase family)